MFKSTHWNQLHVSSHPGHTACLPNNVKQDNNIFESQHPHL